MKKKHSDSKCLTPEMQRNFLAFYARLSTFDAKLFYLMSLCNTYCIEPITVNFFAPVWFYDRSFDEIVRIAAQIYLAQDRFKYITIPYRKQLKQLRRYGTIWKPGKYLNKH